MEKREDKRFGTKWNNVQVSLVLKIFATVRPVNLYLLFT
jgi:hypothetical protein